MIYKLLKLRDKIRIHLNQLRRILTLGNALSLCRRSCLNQSVLLLLFVVTTNTNFTGCFYSFTGASVPPHLKTVFIPAFEDKSGNGELRLREILKDKLTTRFVEDNTLQVSDRINANALLECTIVSFNDAPTIISGGQGNENVSGKRITIGVKVLFKDTVKKRTISEKSYSGYANYESGGGVVANRNKAIDETADRISDDILIGTVSNW
ncbi:MAG: LPS assembly lipoprotein LptE [Ignavibacteria bacterium]